VVQKTDLPISELINHFCTRNNGSTAYWTLLAQVASDKGPNFLKTLWSLRKNHGTL